MHNFEKQISDWRQSLPAKIPPTAREELEAHLRESIQAQLKSGTPTEHAFQKAVEQLGDIRDISAEYAKLDRGLWWPIRVAAWTTFLLALGLSSLYISLLISGQPESPSAESLARRHTGLVATQMVALTFGYLITFMLGALGISYFLQSCLAEITPGQTRSLTKATFASGIAAATLIAIGIVFGMINSKLGSGVAWNWQSHEIGAAAVLLWLIIFTAAHRSPNVTPNQITFLSLIGNFLVIVFGAPYPRGVNFLTIVLFILLGLAPAISFHRKKRGTEAQVLLE